MRLLISTLMVALVILTGCSDPAEAPRNKIIAAMPAPPLPPRPQPIHPLLVVPQPSWDFVRDIGDRLYFDSGDAALSQAALAQIGKWSQFLEKNPNRKLLLEGHTDPRGSDRFNLALGLKRATIIKKRLVRQGVAASRLSTKSYGAHRPAVLGANESAWRQNRRVVAIPQ